MTREEAKKVLANCESCERRKRMPGKMRPSLLNQVIEELNIMERQPHPAFGKAKRDCIKALIFEKLKQIEGCEVCNVIDGPSRPVSREKVWRGEWIVQQDEHKEYIKRCSKCGFPISGWWGADKFCANCGAPMTDEAVEMVMERWKAMKNDKE